MRIDFYHRKIMALCAFCLVLLPVQLRAQSFLGSVPEVNVGQIGTSSGNSNASASNGGGGFGANDVEGGSSFINQYSDKYKAMNAQDIANIKQKNLLDTSTYTVQFARHPDDSYGTVNLRIESPMTIQGCMSAEIPWVTFDRKGRNLQIEMAKPELIPAEGKRYPHYECKITNGTPRIDIPLSRNEMIAYKIDQIKFKSSTAFDSYKVHVGDNDLTLMPLSQGSFVPAARENALKHVFYPVNMVLLRVPSGVDDPNIAYKMGIIARKHKLTPIDRPIQNAKAYQYYALDKDYNVMLPLQRTGITKLDTVTVDDIFHGKDGPYKVSRKADVFVTLPGEFD